MMARTAEQERNRVVLTGPLVLFDGVCNLCSGSVQFLLPRDRTGQLYFAPIQSAIGQQVLERHKLPLEDWDSFVFLDEGRVYLKAEAVLRIVRFLHWPWRTLRILRLLPKSPTDWCYDRVARNRYALFGVRQRCMVPDAKSSARFVL
jgi:predicted DCC family thiol-disulfide oxidoreductase YuxK